MLRRPMTDGEWCWVSADGHLESGSESDLFRAHAEGRLPADNPVWCPSQNAWRTMVDLLAGQQPAVDPLDDAATLRRAAVTPAQADELVPSTQRELPWFLPEPEVPTEKLPASEPPLRVAPTPLAPSILPVTRTVPPPSSKAVPMLIGGGVAVAGALFAFALVVSRLVTAAPGPAHAERQTPSEVASAGLRVERTRLATCTTAVTPLRIAPFVVPSTPITVATFGSSIGVGAVTGRRTGVGLVVAASDLGVSHREWLADSRHLSAVVPASDDAFIADRWTASVPGTSAFTLGMTPKGFSRVGAGTEQSTLWPGDPRQPITRPAIVQTGSGWAVAFRRGDDGVRLGWIDHGGAALGELTSYGSEADRASAPSIAFGDGQLALAYAEHTSEGWQIRLGHAPVGKAPSAMGRFGRDAHSPALAALGRDRWLLAYVQGGERRALRVQLLDTELAPVGAPQTVSDEVSAMPSLALWNNGRRAAVVFTRDRGPERAELWATALDCR